MEGTNDEDLTDKDSLALYLGLSSLVLSYHYDTVT